MQLPERLPNRVDEIIGIWKPGPSVVLDGVKADSELYRTG